MPSGTAERLVDGHADGALSTRLPPETLFHYVHPCAFVAACFFAPLMKGSETWNAAMMVREVLSCLHGAASVIATAHSLKVSHHIFTPPMMTVNHLYTRDISLSTEMLHEDKFVEHFYRASHNAQILYVYPSPCRSPVSCQNG